MIGSMESGSAATVPNRRSKQRHDSGTDLLLSNQAESET